MEFQAMVSQSVHGACPTAGSIHFSPNASHQILSRKPSTARPGGGIHHTAPLPFSRPRRRGRPTTMPAN